MPQQQTRASLRPSTRARRTTRVHVAITGVAALAAVTMAATTAVPSPLPAATQHAVRAHGTPGAQAVMVPMSAVVGAEVAGARVGAEVADAVTQATGALAHAELLAAEDHAVPAEKVAEIEHATSVVRELVRRVETVEEPATLQPLAAGEAPVAADDADAVATALAQQTAALAELIDATPAAGVAVVPAPSPEEIAAKKAAEEAARAAALAAEAARYGNGQIPEHLLAPIPWSTTGSRLRADATAALIRLNEAFKAEFGTDLGITDSYRSYADQVAVKKKRGFWAAKPGHSNHGFAVAVDLSSGIADFSSPQYAWMKANAPAYGWIHPDWAEPGGRKPEPWHWEFTG